MHIPHGKCTEQHQILRLADDFRDTEILDLRTPLFLEGSETLRFYCIMPVYSQKVKKR